MIIPTVENGTATPTDYTEEYISILERKVAALEAENADLRERVQRLNDDLLQHEINGSN